MMKTLMNLLSKKNTVSTYGQIESMLTRRGDIVR